MVRLYKTLENIVKKCVVKPLVIGGLVGVLAYGGKLYGKDILVNAYTEGWQGRPDIAINNNGNFIITWESYYQNYSLFDVFAQRFDKEGNKLGEEFQVNFPTEGRHVNSYVAMDKEGKFIVVWRANRDWKVYAQRFDKNGNKLGDEFRVSATEGERADPLIAMDGQGNSLISFKYGQYGDAYAQRFDKDGNRIGGEFGIDGYESRIAMDPNGDFITTDTDGARETLYAYRYNNCGERIGEALQVSLSKADGADSEIGQSSVALNDTGFVVTWKDYDDSRMGVYAKRFNSDGNDIDEEFRVNRTTEGDQIYPDVAMDCEGDVVITWVNTDGFVADIYAQRYKNGEYIGGEFRVNSNTFSYSPGWDGPPKIATDNKGNFVITWEGDSDIYAKKFSFYNPADLNKDGYVDFKDFGIFTDNWLAYYP